MRIGVEELASASNPTPPVYPCFVPNTLSVAMIAMNEEANLPRTLESVRWSDEIVVVDSGS